MNLKLNVQVSVTKLTILVPILLDATVIYELVHMTVKAPFCSRMKMKITLPTTKFPTVSIEVSMNSLHYFVSNITISFQADETF